MIAYTSNIERGASRKTNQSQNCFHFPNVSLKVLCGFNQTGIPQAGIMEADDCQVTTVFTVQPSFDKPSIMKHYHRQRTTRWSVNANPLTILTLHVTPFVKGRWKNDVWTVKTVVTWRSSASMILAPGWKILPRPISMFSHQKIIPWQRNQSEWTCNKKYKHGRKYSSKMSPCQKQPKIKAHWVGIWCMIDKLHSWVLSTILPKQKVTTAY